MLLPCCRNFPGLWYLILCPQTLAILLSSFSPSSSSLIFLPLLTVPLKVRTKYISFSHVKKQLSRLFFFFVLVPVLRTLFLLQVPYHRLFLNKGNSLPGPRPPVKKIDFSSALPPHEETKTQRTYVDWWELPIWYATEQGLELNCLHLNPIHFLLSSYLRNSYEILQCLVFWYIYWVCVQMKALCYGLKVSKMNKI